MLNAGNAANNMRKDATVKAVQIYHGFVEAAVEGDLWAAGEGLQGNAANVEGIVSALSKDGGDALTRGMDIFAGLSEFSDIVGLCYAHYKIYKAEKKVSMAMQELAEAEAVSTQALAKFQRLLDGVACAAQEFAPLLESKTSLLQAMVKHLKASRDARHPRDAEALAELQDEASQIPQINQVRKRPPPLSAQAIDQIKNTIPMRDVSDERREVEDGEVVEPTQV